MSFDRVLSAPFKNGGFVRLIIGGLLEFVPIIGWFFVAGFMLKCYEHGTENRDEMPEWSEWGAKFADGFMVFLISVIYMIVPLLFLPSIIRFVEYGMRDITLIMIPMLLGIIFGFSIPMAVANYAVNKTFMSAFNLGQIFRLIAAAPGSYIGAHLLYWFANILVIVFVVFIPIIGWLFSIFSGFYLMCVAGLLFGGVYHKAASKIGGKSPVAPTIVNVLKCPQCGSQIRPAEKFCNKCGSKVNTEPGNLENDIASMPIEVRKCQNCGMQITPIEKFCKKCGARVNIGPVHLKEESVSVQGPVCCPQCGSQVMPADRFCKKCGSKTDSGAGCEETVIPAVTPAVIQEVAAGEASPENTPETSRIDAASVETTILKLEDEKYPVLQSVSGDESIAVNKIEFILGRDCEKSDYTFNETVIGRVHAKIISLGGYYIVDLGSKNGTYVNDKRIESNVNCELKDGDRIRFANKEYILKIE